MSKRKSFIIHHDSLDVIDKLTDEQAGKLLKAIKSYQLGEEYELDLMTDLVFTPFKAQFKRDDEKYQKIVERNKNNGLKGGRPKTQDNPTEPNKPSGFSGNPDEPKKADSDSKSKSDSKSDSKIKIKDIFDAERIIPIWNSLGCSQHKGLTKTAEKALEKTYKEYLKDAKSNGKEPKELNDWLETYLRRGFANFMTDHHRDLGNGQWSADLEFAVRFTTYDKIKNMVKK